MKYFRRLRQDVDLATILAEIDARPEAWYAQRGRQSRGVQSQSESIPVRGLRRSKMQGRARRDVHESRFTTLSRQFPATVAFLRAFARDTGARLARAKLVRLKPGAHVLPHVDRGEYYAKRDRYHLVLRSDGGSWLRTGDETVRMQAGELWWFDNKVDHEARNDGATDRVHLIFDLEEKPARGARPKAAPRGAVERGAAAP